MTGLLYCVDHGWFRLDSKELKHSLKLSLKKLFLLLNFLPFILHVYCYFNLLLLASDYTVIFLSQSEMTNAYLFTCTHKRLNHNVSSGLRPYKTVMWQAISRAIKYSLAVALLYMYIYLMFSMSLHTLHFNCIYKIEDFLEKTTHFNSRVKVKSLVVKRSYGSLVQVKI